jgi:hypothetical protein
MNNARRLTSYLLTSLALLSSGCLEIETTTTVNTDGSFVREIEFGDDDTTKGVDLSPLFQTDSTWTSVRHKVKDTSWVTTMTKVFSDKHALAEALRGRRGQSLEICVGFEKRFLWFTTEYAYSETLLCYNQIKAVPLTRYLTPAEVDFWLGHEKRDEKNPFRSTEDSLAFERLEKIGPEWDSRNKFEEFFSLFLEGVKEFNNADLTVQNVTSAKESLYAHCGPILLGTSFEGIDTLQVEVQRVLATPHVKAVFDASSDRFREFQRKVKFASDLMAEPYTKAAIVMPGLITATNARSIEGNRLEWKDFMARGYVADFTMWGESRVINWWAVILTGGAVIVVAALLIFSAMRRRRGL